MSRSTGKERDAETGLDYFLARYYSGAQGRFLSPDEFKGGPDDALTGADITPPGPLPYADISNPQSLNKYAYTYNNPLRYTDPDGHAAWFAGVLVGGGLDIAVQMAIEGKSFKELDWGSVGISAATGAIGGGLASKIGKLKPLTKLLVEGMIDAGGSASQQIHKSGDVSVTETAIDVAGGRVVGAVGGAIAESVAKNSPEVRSLTNAADRKARIAANAEARGNASSAARRTAQANQLNAQAADIVYGRTTAASTSASQLTSTAVKEIVKKKKEQGQ